MNRIDPYCTHTDCLKKLGHAGPHTYEEVQSALTNERERAEREHMERLKKYASDHNISLAGQAGQAGQNIGGNQTSAGTAQQETATSGLGQAVGTNFRVIGSRTGWICARCNVSNSPDNKTCCSATCTPFIPSGGYYGG